MRVYKGSPKDVANRIAKEVHGFTVPEAHERGICVRCHTPPTFYSEAGRHEYRISGLCEPCFDAVTQFDEESPQCPKTL